MGNYWKPMIFKSGEYLPGIISTHIWIYLYLQILIFKNILKATYIFKGACMCVWCICVLLYAREEGGKNKESTCCAFGDCACLIFDITFFTMSFPRHFRESRGTWMSWWTMCVDVILVWSLAPLCPVLQQPPVVLDHLSHVCGYSSCPADRHMFAPSPREAHMPFQILLVLQAQLYVKYSVVVRSPGSGIRHLNTNLGSASF